MQNMLWELTGLGGLAMVGIGLWWLAPWLSLVCVGSAFLWAGIRGSTIKKPDAL